MSAGDWTSWIYHEDKHERPFRNSWKQILLTSRYFKYEKIPLLMGSQVWSTGLSHAKQVAMFMFRWKIQMGRSMLNKATRRGEETDVINTRCMLHIYIYTFICITLLCKIYLWYAMLCRDSTYQLINQREDGIILHLCNATFI